MTAILENINVVANEELAKIEKSKSIKTKPKTFTGTKKYWFGQLKEKMVNAQTINSIDANFSGGKIEKLQSLNVFPVLFGEYSQAGFVSTRPIKIKPKMYGNTVENCDKIIISLTNEAKKAEEIAKQPIRNIPSKTIEEIESEEILKMLQSVRSEVKPVIPSKTIEEIENEEILKLMKSIARKHMVKSSKTLQEIEEEEILKLANKDTQLRDEIQLVPERSQEYQEMIDNEFANQEVTLISAGEVQDAINFDDVTTEEITTERVSKNSQKTVKAMDEKENAIKMIEKSIAEALRKIRLTEDNDNYEDVYQENKKEVEKEFEKIEKETGKSIEDIFSEIYLSSRKSVDDIFDNVYGETSTGDDKPIEDYFAEIYTKTGKDVEEIFADIYDVEDRNVEEIFNKLYVNSNNSESIEEIFAEIYENEKRRTEEIFEEFEETTGTSIEDIFANIYGNTGKSVDELFTELYGTPEGVTGKSIEDYFTEARISQGKTVDEVFSDIYETSTTDVEEIFNDIFNEREIINNLLQINNMLRTSKIKSKLNTSRIKDVISFEDIFKRAKQTEDFVTDQSVDFTNTISSSLKNQIEKEINKKNNIEFDYERQESKIMDDNRSTDLTEMLKLVREKQNQKNNLKKSKAMIQQEQLKAKIELEERVRQREAAMDKARIYIEQLEAENKANMNEIEEYNQDIDSIVAQTQKEQDEIDAINEAIGAAA